MNNYSDVELEAAHKHSFANRKPIQNSEQCGCFNCCCMFPATMVEQWYGEKNDEGDTGLCPGCGIDSLIGDATGISLTKEFLVAMNTKYFDGLCEIETEKVRAELYKMFEDGLAAKKKSS